MGFYKELDGDLISLAKDGKFDVIAHGCNCHCTMGAGIAPQMAKAFGADRFKMEAPQYQGDINKLGTIDSQKRLVYKGEVSIDKSTFFTKWGHIESDETKSLVVVNAYTQYNYGANHADGTKKPVDYDAITLVMRKINYIFQGQHIGLPKIGAGLAGGDWNIIKMIIQQELKDCDVTIVNYVK